MTENRSFKDRLWHLPDAPAARIRELVRAGVPAAAAPVLTARGLTPDAAAAFCHCSLDTELKAAERVRDLGAAAKRLAQAVQAREQVAVFGDYDVDGATSTALLVRALRHWGLDARIYIPDRLSEGYGPNVPAVETLAREGIDLIVFVDSGIAAHAPLARACELGLDAVVVDHHAVQGDLPPAVACVNPNRHDDGSGLGHLCAAGLVWLLVRETDRKVARSSLAGRTLDLRPLLDLVALGTIADVVPLTGLNRAFAAEGLKVMGATHWAGLKALAVTSGAEAPFDAYHCGFMLGPRINAGGRIGACDTGARLLSTDDPVEADQLATTLNAWNVDRQQMEQDVKAEALDALGTPDKTEGALFAVGKTWHEGVIGIVASRLKDAFDLPSFVLTEGEDGLLKGSARSMPGFDLGAAVIAAREAGILEKGGGHPMAAGLSLRPENLDAFRAFVRDRVEASDFARTGAVTRLDVDITPDAATRRFAEALEALAPFGVGAPRPRVRLHGGIIRDLKPLPDRRTGTDLHLKLEYAAPSGRGVKAIAFKVIGTPLADRLIAARDAGLPVDLAGTLRLNTFRGRTTAELDLDDARLACAADQAGEFDADVAA